MKAFGMILAAAMALCAASCENTPIRVACLGDSITYGHGIADRENDTYPALLQQQLGSRFDVRNFGVCGVTAMSGTDMPYINEQAYKDALAFGPQIVTLMLGTNDSKTYNWQGPEKFKTDMEAILNEISVLPSKPEIWLMLPTPAMGHAWSINDSIIEGFIIPQIKTVAQERNLKIVDLNTPFQGQRQYFPDTIHPTEEADSIIAGIVLNTVFKK